MLKDYLDFVGRKYRNEAGEGADLGGGEGAATDGEIATGAAAEGAATDDGDTLLTGGEKDAAGKESEDGKTSEGEAGKEGSDTPPDTYADFVLPEGMALDEAALTEATPMFKELGLTQQQAQQVIDLYAKQVQAGSQKLIDDFNQMTKDWREQAVNDKEFGGDKWDKSKAAAQLAINKFGTPEFKQMLEDHGMGNHPEVIRFMVKVGQTLKEDVPGAAAGNVSAEVDRVGQMYPNG